MWVVGCGSTDLSTTKMNLPEATELDFAEIYACQLRGERDEASMHTVQHRVDHFESLVNLLSDFRTSQDNLATDEDEEYNLRLDHTIDLTTTRVSVCVVACKTLGIETALSKTYKTREELGLV